MIYSLASSNRNESPFSNRPIRQEAQMSEYIYFQNEPIFDSLEMIPTTPQSRKDQETQTISTQNNGVQSENIPNSAAFENRHCPEIPSHGNLITITIGAPTEQSKAPTTVVNSNNSCATAPTPASNTSNGNNITPPTLPLPMLPTPNGITIPPPPQEDPQETGTRTGNQNKKCCNACGNCGCCGCGNLTPAHKMYLMYAIIAVCASLVIALVPILVTSLTKSNN